MRVSTLLKKVTQHVKNHASYSYWLETCGDDLTPRPSMDGSIDVDVAIMGAGFSGLWTAYYLLKKDPSLKIALLEREIAGFGASGRNGAICSSGFPIGLNLIEERHGYDASRGVQIAMFNAVDNIERFSIDEQVDIEWTKGGRLSLALGKHQLPAINQSMKMYEKFGFGDRFELLDEVQTAERVTVAGAVGALYAADAATDHPGKLVRGLARVVERMGATIYEQTPVTDFTTGAYPALHTAHGHARAKTIVLCGESYLPQLKKTHRAVLPAYSLITLTEPLSDADWQQIGWESREGLSSMSFMVTYLSKTSDGRILFGGRGAPYHFGSSIKDEYDRHAPTHQRLQATFRKWFPALKDVKFTHSWGGSLGWSRDWMPTMTYDPRENLGMAGAYTGTGMATSNLAGQLLSDQILNLDTDLTHLPMAHHKPRSWEPEPLRFLGARFVQRGFERLDAKAERTGVAPDGTSLVERLTRH